MAEARELMNGRYEQLSHRGRPMKHSLSNESGDETTPGDTASQINPREFVLKRLIGAGGVCKVYEAIHRNSGRSFCVKVLKRQFRYQSRFIEQFREEYRLTAKLSHLGIVATHGLGRLPDGGYFLVLDLVAGTNLQKYLKSKSRSTIEVARIVAQVADCVAHSHQNGVVHCDLKPANVLIDVCGKAWVTDFGFALELQSLNSSVANPHYIAGTPAYLAPEQFMPAFGRIGTLTDIHGLGAILFESLASSPPYAKRTLATLEHGATDESIDFGLLKHAPVPIVDICRRCLARSPKERFEDANSVATSLREWLDAQQA
jgi:eukaryotic-like serine/threonine-protein kinase